MTDFSTGIPNIRVIIREASDENLTLNVPNLTVKLQQGSQYNVNITPNHVTTLRTGSFNSYADLANTAITASYAHIAQTLIGSIQTASYAYTASNILGGAQNYIPVWSPNTLLSSSLLYQTASSVLLGATTQHTPEAPDRFGVFAGATNSYNLISAHGEIDNYLQLNLKNFSSGVSASSDIVATANNGTEISAYIDMGINGSGYINNGNGIGTANDGYLYLQGAEDLLIGNTNPDKNIILFTGGGDAHSNARVFIDPSGSVGINTKIFSAGAPEVLFVQSISDTTYNLIKGVANVNNYVQFNIINSTAGTSASSDVVATADNGTETSNYIDMGINSSVYGLPNVIGGPNDAYLYSTGNHLYIGNASTGQDVIFFVGSDDVEAATKLILRNDNQHILSGSLTITDGSIIGSLFGTASWALNAVTASYVSGSSTVGPGTAQSIALFNSSNTISSSVIFQSGSNVGINTLSPTETLRVNGTFSSNAIWTTTNGITNWGAYPTIYGTLTWDVGYARVYATTGNRLDLGANGSNAHITITGSGNVGIGTTGPINKLQIAGNVSASSYTSSISNAVGFFGTSSWAQSASISVSSSFATTASAANSITFTTFSNASYYFPSNVRVDGTASVRILQTQFVTSSIIFESGSTKFGDSLDDTHQFTGSLSVLGTINGQLTGSLLGTASVASNVGPGTSGSIALFNTPTNLSSSTIFQSGNNIGIGTSSPGTLLDVSGTTPTARIIGTSGTTPKLTLSSAGVSAWSFRTSGSDSSFRLDQDGTDRITVLSGGNVGIGITSPTARLHVSGANNTTPIRVSIGNNATYNFSGDSTSGYVTTFNMDDTGSSFGHNSSLRDLQLRTNSTTRLTILGGGNVGIGTTSPSTTLQVSGSQIIDGTLNIYDSGSNNFPLSIGYNSRTTSEYIRVNASASTERGLAFSTAGSLRWITYANSSTESTGDAGSNYAISAYNDAGAVIDTPFSIVRAASGVITLNRNIRTLTGSVGAPVISPTTDTNTGIYFPASDNIAFVEGGTEAMRIDNFGNVGIGITAPTAKLDIGGAIDGNVQAVFTRGNDGLFQLQAVNASAANTTGALVSKFGLRYSGSGDAAVFKFYRGGGAQDASVAIELNGGTEALRAVASGRVGIGTTTPSTTLQVSGSQIIDGGLTVYESGSSVWPITAGYSTRPTTTIIRVNASSSTFRGYEIQTGGTRRWLMYADSNPDTGGDAGSAFAIGAYNDAGTFIDNPIQIIRASGSLMYLNRPLRVTTGSNSVTSISPASGYGITFPTATNIGFVINSSEAMRIDSSGRVGIGTTAPSASLQIQGNVSASSYTSSISNTVGFFGTASWATSASVASGFTGTANRVLYNNASNVTTTSANLTFDGTNLTVGGQLNAATKSFLINHKTKPGKKLVYGVVEGPEHSVFIRGRLTGTNTIVLPNEWDWLVDLDSITVQLTAIGKPQKLFVKSVDKLYITVENGEFFSGPIDCYYLIQATRKDVEPLQTVV